MEDELIIVPKPAGEIWVTKFDEEHAQKFRVAVLDAARGDSSKPIIIHVDSYGGYVDALAKMIETMDEVSNPIVTVCMGKAMSCGAILLSHGDVRFLGRHSRVMVHEISSGTIGNVHDMKDDVKETVRLNEQFMGLLANNCGFKNYDELRTILKAQDGRDLYLSGEEAVKFGIVDAIGLPRIASKTFYEVGQQAVKAPAETRTKQTLIVPKVKASAKPKKRRTKKSETRKR